MTVGLSSVHIERDSWLIGTEWPIGLAGDLRRVQERIAWNLRPHGAPRELRPVFEYLAASRGKMTRPMLVLLAGRCFGTTTESHVQVAAVVEMIHLATLLHDDVIDYGQMRRGRPTVNWLWGSKCAVLSGDMLLSRVLGMVAGLGPRVVGLISETTLQVCLGEMRQTFQKGNWHRSEAEYLAIVAKKTASFFCGCCRLGAALAEADEDQAEALGRYGLHAGIAFQIADDLLDINGREQRAGKGTQSDLVQETPTLPIVHLLTILGGGNGGAATAVLAQCRESKDVLRKTLERYGSLSYASRRAEGHIGRAVSALAEVPGGPAREALVRMVHGFIDRQR